MINIFYFLFISLAFNMIMFLFAFKFKTDKLTDISYALSFIFLILLSFLTSDMNFFKIILCFMLLIWSFRIGTFLFIRINKIKKDRRFDGMREDFIKFLSFWLLQAVTVWIILIPSILFFSSSIDFNYFMLFGLLVWILGLAIETIADIQKFNFNKNNKNDKWISTGLWKYSRHPNYFGEILCWIGVYIFTFSSLNILERLFGLLSPIFIAFLLIFVSGIPLLEKYADKKWDRLKEYQEYKRKTNILTLWFTKK